MNNLISYIKNAYEELMHKVSWPSWAELQSSAIIVLTASLLIALFIWVMDFVSKGLMNDVIYKALS